MAAENDTARVELRLPRGLKERAQRVADSNRRSLRKEVQVALEHHIDVLEREQRRADSHPGRV